MSATRKQVLAFVVLFMIAAVLVCMGVIFFVPSGQDLRQSAVTSEQAITSVRKIIMDERLHVDYVRVVFEDARDTFRGDEIKLSLLDALEHSTMSIKDLQGGLPAMMGHERLQFTYDDNRTPFAIEIIEPCRFAWLDHDLGVVVYADGESLCAFLDALRAQVTKGE